MRRIAPLLLIVAALPLAGCNDSRPNEKTVTPTPTEIVGKAPRPPRAVKGDASAGKTVYAGNGCGACHTFTPAASSGTVGPDLDKLPQYAQQANQGSLEDFTKTSITDPGAYVQPGYPNGVMPSFSSL